MLTHLLVLAVSFGQGYGYGQASAQTAQVRAINAIADLQWADLSVGGVSWRSVGYGQRTDYASAETRRAMALVEGPRGERVANDVAVDLQRSYPHTVIFAGSVMPKGQFTPIVLRDSTAGRPSQSSSQLQFVNALSDGTPVVIKVDGEKLSKFPTLAFGAQSTVIGFSPKERTLTVEDPAGARIYSTAYKLNPGMRYLAVVMGSRTSAGLRGPRLYFYAF